MNYTQLTLDSSMIGLGDILGTTAPQEFYKQIAQRAGYTSGYFGSESDPRRTGHMSFITNIVNKADMNRKKFEQASVVLSKPDVIRPIDSIAALKEGIPSSMFLPILLHKPIANLLKDERIYGFGIGYNDLPKDDCYGRIINSGVAYIHSDSEDFNEDTGILTIETEERSYDPELNFDEIDAIWDTRKFLDEFLTNEETAHIDPTCYPELMG